MEGVAEDLCVDLDTEECLRRIRWRDAEVEVEAEIEKNEWEGMLKMLVARCGYLGVK